MRIIAGAFRGRRLVRSADRRVRPTADRVREAWFNILGGEVVDAAVLDLFAGSGALGLEALSRGARAVTFVELSPRALDAIARNVATLGVGHRVTIRRADVERFVAGLTPGAFDLAFADPPYGTGQAARLVEWFRARPFARILGVEHRAGEAVPGDETRRYGAVALTFVRAP